MQDGVEQFLAEMRAELRALREARPGRLPTMLNLKQAAFELGITRKMLKQMIAAGGIRVTEYEGTCREFIPAEEVLRIKQAADFRKPKPKSKPGPKPRRPTPPPSKRGAYREMLKNLD